MLAEITALIMAYKYWAILPFALFEAPLMSIVIGFFAAAGQLDLFLAFGIVVLNTIRRRAGIVYSCSRFRICGLRLAQLHSGSFP